MEHQYILCSDILKKQLGDQFDDMEDAVIVALYSTERTSSMIENLNGRVRKHLYYRQESGHSFLDLLRFYLNHTPFYAALDLSVIKNLQRKTYQGNRIFIG